MNAKILIVKGAVEESKCQADVWEPSKSICNVSKVDRNLTKVFRFKQFVIDDSQCAMKVGTDAILLASWVPKGNYQHILDVGTGSGLIAIMLAQKSHSQGIANILGIDINADAINQAKENAQATPWSSRLFFQQTRLQDYQPPIRYDLIVSNPPFFESNQLEMHENDANYIHPTRRTARQTIDLSLSELIENVARSLESKGNFYCILPCERADEVIQIALQYNLHCIAHCFVQSTPSKAPKRSMMGFSRDRETAVEQRILVRDEDNCYTTKFKQLCREFYLNF